MEFQNTDDSPHTTIPISRSDTSQRSPAPSDSSGTEVTPSRWCCSRVKRRRTKPRTRDARADVVDSGYWADPDTKNEADAEGGGSANKTGARSASDKQVSSPSDLIASHSSSNLDVVSMASATLVLTENADRAEPETAPGTPADGRPPKWHESFQNWNNLTGMSKNNCGMFSRTSAGSDGSQTSHQQLSDDNFLEAGFSARRNDSPMLQSSDFFQGDRPTYDAQPVCVLLVYDNNRVERVELDTDLGKAVSILKRRPVKSESLDKMVDRFTSLPLDKMDHYSRLGQFVRNLKREDRMIDVLVHIDNQVFSAHRHVLACHSRYFSDILGNIPSKQRLPIELKLENITTDAFQSFLQYVYTGEIDLNFNNVGERLHASEQLNVPVLHKKCRQYMEHLDPNQALLVLAHGAEKNTTVYNIAFKAVLDYYEKIFDSEDFLDLDVTTLCALLSHDDLVVIAELDVFWTGLMWVVSDIDSRLQYLTQVMQCVRFPLMSQAELIYCVSVTDLLKSNPACRAMILNSNWLLMCRSVGREDPLHIPKPHKRKCFKNRDYNAEAAFQFRDKQWSAMSIKISQLMSSPAFQESLRSHNQAQVVINTNAVDTGVGTDSQLFDVKSKYPGHFGSVNQNKLQQVVTALAVQTSTDVPDRVFRKSDVQDVMAAAERISSNKNSTQQLLDDILLVGGFTNASKKDVISVERYDSTTDQWNHFAGLPEPRDHHAVAVMDEKLFLVGGCDPKKSKNKPHATSTVFMYNLDEREWYKMANMLDCRMHHSVCVVLGVLYAVGGQNEKHRILNTVECFNLRSNSWSYVASMNTARCSMGAAVHDGYVYIAGGFGKAADKKSRMPILDKMEIYSPRTDRWTDACRLSVARCYANLVSVDNHVYLCGGATRKTGSADSLVSVSAIDVYDPFEDRWEECTDLFHARHNAGAIVMGNKIYIMGGVSSEENDTLQTIECFDTTTQTWDRPLKMLPHPATGIGCVTVPVRRF